MEKLIKIIKEIPEGPGIYLFRAENGDLLYIGKAVSLRKRISHYFRKGAKTDPKVSALVSKTAKIDYIPLKTETESLILEDRLVKEYQPRYNIELKDDKHYPLIRITTKEPWTRIQLVRLRQNDGNKYFGPYPDSGSLRRVLRYLQKTFKLKRCKTKFPNAENSQHCLYFHLGECMAPCLRKISPVEYQETIKEIILLLEGRGEELLKKLRVKMFYMSKHKNYENAAQIRDLIKDLELTIGSKIRKKILEEIPYQPAEIHQEVLALKETLHLAKLPLWIDAFDISNLSGKDAVGSLIVFKNGVPYKNGYRRFKIKTVTGINDYAMINEIMLRRYKRLIAEKDNLPDLILIDGGKGQYSTAKKILNNLGIKNIKIVGLAKKYNELYRPNVLKLPKNSLALKLLTRVRDEAHRFAINYHRKLRRKRINLAPSPKN